MIKCEGWDQLNLCATDLLAWLVAVLFFHSFLARAGSLALMSLKMGGSRLAPVLMETGMVRRRAGR
jgi:hypothetical protein